MMSMSGGWFFVVASEAITVGNHHWQLPGIGSYVALALERRDLAAVGWAIVAMLVVILLYDQLLFRPLVAWSDHFRFETTASAEIEDPWLLRLFRRTDLLRRLRRCVGRGGQHARPACGWRCRLWARRRRGCRRGWSMRSGSACCRGGGVRPAVDRGLPDRRAELGGARAGAAARAVHVDPGGGADRARLRSCGCRSACGSGCARCGRGGCSRWCSSSRRFRPICCSRRWCCSSSISGSSPDIWLTPLMILGTQWYILFNVIAGAAAFPGDLREAADSLGLRGRLWWRRVDPAGDLPLLRHRRDHRFGRRVERRDRRRGGELGPHHLGRARPRRLHRPRHRAGQHDPCAPGGGGDVRASSCCSTGCSGARCMTSPAGG